jgi:poly[(R)-3-hydroxyalkanoate] polymerase subunit PhaC
VSSKSRTGSPPKKPSAPTHENGPGFVPTRETTTPGTSLPGPDTMLGLWTSWLDSLSVPASDMGLLPRQAARQMLPDQLIGGLQQFGAMAANDPILNAILRATDDALNANPLRQIIPVDWAEIARALRTVLLRSISRPERTAAAAVDFNMRQIQTSMDTWNGGDCAGWHGPTRRLRAARTSASPHASGETALSIGR